MKLTGTSAILVRAMALCVATFSFNTWATTPVNQNAIAPAKTQVAQALTLKDNTPVTLTGKVTKSLGDEKYQFRDATGTITADIDDELWNGRALAANATVTLHGEVDVDYLPKKRVEIDVKHIQF